MNQFENYLSHTDKKQKIMIYAIVLMVLLFVLNFIVTPMQEEIANLESSIASVEKSIAKNSVNSLKKEIERNKQEFLKVNTEVEQQKEVITALLSKLYTVKYAFFNEKEFANSLDEMLKKSINAHLKIDFIKSSDVPKEEVTKLLKHKKRLEIGGTGEYKEIVSFIHHIENLNVILKFASIKLESAKDNVKFLLVVDIFGVGL
ncbi:MAG: type 4a pilus biogenesis protein PilO [Sulfurospirillaceae bacterium]|nr:type 4a pilus biogenesis protein PilO [Sulfurospirillaceae bacterium]